MEEESLAEAEDEKVKDGAEEQLELKDPRSSRSCVR